MYTTRSLIDFYKIETWKEFPFVDQPWICIPIKDQDIEGCETTEQAVARGIKIKHIPEGVSGVK